jgi:hypothetical protein
MLQRTLARELLKRARDETPTETDKKIANLRGKYGSEDSWDYPQASLDRLLEIASLADESEVDAAKVAKVGERYSGDKEKPQPGSIVDDMVAFGNKVHQLYKETVGGTGNQIVSIDVLRRMFLQDGSVGEGQFDASFLELLHRDKRIIEFSGRIGEEKGILRDVDGKHIYRFMIQE